MKAIFLDIDGVLQPSYNDKRHEVDRKAIAKSLAEQFQANVTLDSVQSTNKRVITKRTYG